MTKTNRPTKTLRENASGIALFSIGAVMIVVAFCNLEHEAVAIALIGAGLLAMAFGVILHRVEGPLKFNKDGFEAFLAPRLKEANTGETSPLPDVLSAGDATNSSGADESGPHAAADEPSEVVQEGPEFTRIVPRLKVELTDGARRDLDQYEPDIRDGIVRSILQTLALSDSDARKHSSEGSLDYLTAKLGPAMTMAYREIEGYSPTAEGKYVVLGIYPA